MNTSYIFLATGFKEIDLAYPNQPQPGSCLAHAPVRPGGPYDHFGR